jgi:hypothetical protein
MKSKKNLLKGAAIATLLASSPSLGGSTALSNKQVVSKSKRNQRLTTDLVYTPTTTTTIPSSRRDVAVVKEIENLVDIGLHNVEQLLDLQKKTELLHLHDQLTTLKDDVSNTLSILLQQHADVRKRYLSKVNRILEQLRSYRQHTRNKQTLKLIASTIVVLSFVAFLSARSKRMSDEESTRRLRHVYRFYQALDQHRQSGFEQQVALVQKAPDNIPPEFRCPLTNKLKVVPVRIGEEPETYDAGSLLMWIQEHLPHHKKQDVIAALNIDNKLQDQVYEYLKRRLVYRRKILPQYMQVARYYPGTGSKEYMDALQRFNTQKKKLSITSQQKNAGKSGASHGGMSRTPT